MQPHVRHVIRIATAFVLYGAFAAVLWAPVAAERAIETIRFEDRIGTVPVEISLTHNGVSTLDTGVLGSLYWEQTGAGGFGARVRVTDTPEAGGTLASYASPRFVRANASFVTDPDAVARAYGDELRSRLLRDLLLRELAAFLIGGLVLTAAFRGRSPLPAAWPRGRSVLLGAGIVAALAATSCGTAGWLFDRWEGNTPPEETFAMPGVPDLAFSSPQALEIARQVQPFLEKNQERVRERTDTYAETAATTFATELTLRTDDLAPRAGEVIVVAEADPQGSHVGTRVRSDLYHRLLDSLGRDSFALRTISGDVTSNGTVAEAGYVSAEARVVDEIPLVVVKGDHDTDTTIEQLDDSDVINPDRDLTEVSDLQVVAANDPAFKTLFGGMVVNESGMSETEVGEDLRAYVDDEEAGAVIVLVHQPATAAAYLGLDSLDAITAPPVAPGDPPDLTTPYDDGIPDLPPGIVNIGHLHDAELPRVVWNTDGDDITWTVVNQLGTSGGVEERPTFNRFSTPYSVPLKTLSFQLQYVAADTGLQTGYVAVDLATDGTATISERTDIGVP